MSNLAKARALYNPNLSSKENTAIFIEKLGIKKVTATVYSSKFKKESGAGEVKANISAKAPKKTAAEPRKSIVPNYKPQCDLGDFFSAMSQEEKEAWPEELAALTEYYTNNPVFGASKRRVGAE